MTWNTDPCSSSERVRVRSRDLEHKHKIKKEEGEEGVPEHRPMIKQ